MVKVIKEPRPPKMKDDLVKREQDFSKILEMEISDAAGLQFETVNIAAWKTAFHKKSGDKKFTFKKQDATTYKVWRYA